MRTLALALLVGLTGCGQLMIANPLHGNGSIQPPAYTCPEVDPAQPNCHTDRGTWLTGSGWTY